MVVLRLTRGGAKKRPFYHVVATDKRNPRNGSYLERLGYFNPLSSAVDRLVMNVERIQYWLGVGAHMSPKVQFLYKNYQTQQA